MEPHPRPTSKVFRNPELLDASRLILGSDPERAKVGQEAALTGNAKSPFGAEDRKILGTRRDRRLLILPRSTLAPILPHRIVTARRVQKPFHGMTDASMSGLPTSIPLRGSRFERHRGGAASRRNPAAAWKHSPSITRGKAGESCLREATPSRVACRLQGTRYRPRSSAIASANSR